MTTMSTLSTSAPEPAVDVPQQAAGVEPASTAPPPAARPTAPPVRPLVRRLALSGDLDRADVAELEPQLHELVRSGARTVELDLSRVRSMDAAVARLLLRTSWRLGDPERALVLLSPQRQVRRVLRFVGAGPLVVR